MANPLISAFVQRQTRRITLVDFLNVKLSSNRAYPTMHSFCEHMADHRPGEPLIIVSKKMYSDLDDYSAITSKWPNVLVIICGSEPRSKNHSIAKPCAREDYLAEADDHIIVLLTIAITTTGCAPVIMSNDRYRNALSLANAIPVYQYTTYHKGECHADVMTSGAAWIRAHIQRFIGETAQCPERTDHRDCSLCKKNILVCPLCFICATCRKRFKKMRASAAMSAPECTRSAV
jgi:hypothetical protein